MQKIIKHNWNDRHKLFFTSDIHWNHTCLSWETPLWKSRGFSSVEESNEYAIVEINRVVSEDSVLYHLGDGFLNCSDQQIMDFWKRINCKDVRYIFGNHDAGMYRIMQNAIKEQYGLEGVEVYPTTWENVTFLGNKATLKVGKRYIDLCHYAQRIWDKQKWQSWSLSGHSHMNDIGRLPSSPVDKAFDIGWCGKKSPWLYQEIDDVMETKTIKIRDHHDD